MKKFIRHITLQSFTTLGIAALAVPLLGCNAQATTANDGATSDSAMVDSNTQGDTNMTDAGTLSADDARTTIADASPTDAGAPTTDVFLDDAASDVMDEFPVYVRG